MPKYTAERYYLLSELEQVVSFVFIDEEKAAAEGEGTRSSLPVASPLSPHAAPAACAPTRFYYLLWDLKKLDAAGMMSLLSRMLEYGQHQQWATCPERSMLAVEVLTTDKRWRENDETAIAAVYEWVKKDGRVGHVVFGLADCISGTAALEAVFDCIRRSRKRSKRELLETSPVKICIIAESRDALLGHDADREPDAESGVSQALLYSVPDNAWILGGDNVDNAGHSLDIVDVLPYARGFLFAVACLVAIVYQYLHFPGET